MSNFPRPQFGNSPVGFVYFQNSPSEAASSSSAGETLDYIEFSNTPSTSFQPGSTTNPQQFLKRKSNYFRGNRNKNYKQLHSDVNYPPNKQYSQQHGNYNPRGNLNPRENFSPRGNYSPRGQDTFSPRGNYNNRGNFTPRGNYSPQANFTARGNYNPRGNFIPRGKRGNFNPRGNYNQRGNYRNQRGYNKKQYGKTDIRRYVNRSMVEDPWEHLLDKLKLKGNFDFSGLNVSEACEKKVSSEPKSCTVTSAALADSCDDKMASMNVSDKNLSENSKEFSAETKSGTNADDFRDLNDEKLSSESGSDKNLSESFTEIKSKASTSSALDNEVADWYLK